MWVVPPRGWGLRLDKSGGKGESQLIASILPMSCLQMQYDQPPLSPAAKASPAPWTLKSLARINLVFLQSSVRDFITALGKIAKILESRGPWPAALPKGCTEQTSMTKKHLSHNGNSDKTERHPLTRLSRAVNCEVQERSSTVSLTVSIPTAFPQSHLHEESGTQC